VTAYKKKIVAFLIVAAVGSVALGIRTTGSAATPQTSTRGTEPAKPLFDNFSSPFANNGPNIRDLFFRVVLAILLVVVLGAAAIYISKKFLPRIANLAGKKIHIIETVYLGPRKAVHLLKIGNRQLLIGSTSESITKLADITANGSFEMDLSAAEKDNI